MSRIVLVGGGGLAKEVLDLARMAGHSVVGYMAPQQTALPVPYWGSQPDWAARHAEFDGLTLAFGALGRPQILARAAVIADMQCKGLAGISIVSPHALVCSGAVVGDGSVVAHHVILAVDSVVGAHCMLNNAAQLGHDAVLQANVTLAPMAFVAGAVQVGENSLVGPGAIVLQGLRVGAGSVIGAGCTVLREVPAGSTVLPVASRVLQTGD
jgi:acetyltransferase EpsM